MSVVLNTNVPPSLMSRSSNCWSAPTPSGRSVTLNFAGRRVCARFVASTGSVLGAFGALGAFGGAAGAGLAGSGVGVDGTGRGRPSGV
jgi:hypothetical protein